MTFVLTTAILKMADAKAGQFNFIFNLKSLSNRTYTHVPQLFKKWPLNHCGTKKNGKRVLSSVYYLDDFKTCCQDDIPKYASFTVADALIAHDSCDEQYCE